MPNPTPKLGLKKPLGNETVSRAAYNENLDLIDQNAASQADFDTHKTASVLDHPDGSVTDAKIGNRTISDTAAPTGDTGTPTNLWSWLAYMIKAITGKSNWRTAPATTLEAAKSHIDATTGVHGATSAATPNTLVQRDSAGRFKAAAPSASDDVARKAEVDGKVSKSGDTMTGNLAFGDGRGILLRNGDNESYLTLGDFPESTSSNVEVRLFRNTNTSGQKRFFIMRGDGSTTVEFGITDGEIVVIKGVMTKITAGSGSPEGRVTANPGSIYLNRSGGAGVSIWVKESGTGNTGWVAK